MPKSLIDFNREYDYKCYLEETQAAKISTKKSIIKSTVFYAVLIIAVMSSFLYSGSKDAGKRFGPFAYNTVLTPSMNSVYPKGSLVTSWAVKPGEALKAGLSNGTDIVFTREDGTVIVHRIIEIMENYEDSGQRAFHTQGVDNPTPDNWITYEGNVIGRVTWHVPYAGDILAFIAAKILWFIIGIAGLFALSALLRIVFSNDKTIHNV